MTERERKRSGGFMATVALILSVIAIIVSLLAYERSGRTSEEDIAALKTRIVELRKAETQLRQKMAALLEKADGKIKTEEPDKKPEGQ